MSFVQATNAGAQVARMSPSHLFQLRREHSNSWRLTTSVDAGTLATSWLQEERGCPICDKPLPTSKSPVPPPHYPLQHKLLMNAVFTRQILCYCDACQDQNQASLHCMTCLYNFCPDCGAKHYQTRTKNGGIHEVRPLWQAKRFRRTTVCLEHPEYPLRFYCVACQQVICSECMWRDVHRGHATEEHTAASKITAAMLANAIRSARILLDSLLIRYTANSFSSGRLCRSRCSNQSRMRIEFDREELLYTKEARHRIEEYTRLRNARYLLDAISLTEQLLTEGTDAEILSLSKIILKRFNALGVNVRAIGGLANADGFQNNVSRHSGIFHCCTFCSSGGKKEATCACPGTMLGGYKGCGHGHPGHPRVKHWSCCGSIDRDSVCPRLSSQNIVYRFTL
ncbi:hypothetical protein PV328_005659 [Microctonus aethiopoides]|uniref:B box-type domain-containing protein n=2 Tax=Microctonus aethiopoides TaxID=144406 RepID=A0AA39FN62_9HYME|nr:hypothetical protein PV328_005659 [Microctonus aethiopoides]